MTTKPKSAKSGAVKSQNAKGGAKTKIDWNEAKRAYISDATLSYSDIAKKFGVSLKVVKDYGAKGQWPKARQSLSDKAQASWEDKLPSRQKEAQNRHLEHFQKLAEAVRKSIEQQLEPQPVIAFGNIVKVDGKVLMRNISASGLESLAKAMKIAVEGERVILGQPNNVTGHTDGKGGNVWGGLAELALEAKEILKNAQSDKS